MEKQQNTSIKIRRISIRNYKSIDELVMDFPAPLLNDDPDIVVMGSRNGLGKTSIIECCSLLLSTIVLHGGQLKLSIDNLRRGISGLTRNRYSNIDVPDLLIKSGTEFTQISGNICINNAQKTINITITRNGSVHVTGKGIPETDSQRGSDSDTNNLINAICGLTPNPVVESSFLLFHSHRKVQEGNPELGMMVNGKRPVRGLPWRYEPPMSSFKLMILRAMMGSAAMFEFTRDEEQEPTQAIEILNKLVRQYAGGTINKLRPSPDNTVDFRINPTNGKDSFTFDGLSSGQKEIISTLFLVWHHTKTMPRVVFIDEPELHLNAEWHRSFVRTLIALAPHNQYILATHSEDVMDSVDEDRRFLLEEATQ